MNIAPLKMWVGDTMCHPVFGRAVRQVFRDRIPSRGCTIDTTIPDITPQSVASLFWGLYEKDEIRFLRQYLKRDLDAVELGASIGVVSSHLARLQAVGKKLVCVEANPRLIETTRRNLAVNAPGRKAEVVHAAVDYSGRPEVKIASLGDHLVSRVEADTATPSAIVPTVTLGALLARFGIGGDYVLVCDIEGAEAGLLLHEDDALRRCRQVVIELHPITHAGRDWSADDLANLVCERHGFRERDRRHRVHVFDRAG